MNKFVKKYRILIGIYLIWLLLNLLLLSISSYDSRSNKYFFPFDGDLSDYDKSEYIFYSISPIFLFFIYLAFKVELRKIELKNLLKIKILKILIPIVAYIIWISVQIKLLSLSGNLEMDECFFPFTKSKYHPFADINYYNISELLVYSIVPLVLIILYYIVFTKRKKIC